MTVNEAAPGLNGKRVRVKFCGITRAEDALMAADLGADAIGLIFYSKSPRAVDVEQARSVLAAVPPLLTTVGVFVNPHPDELAAVLDEVPLDCLQFHGDESAAFCAQAGRPWIKAIGMRDGFDVHAAAASHVSGTHRARGLLLDTYSARRKGGTGRTFDWTLIPGDLPAPIMLAGGLDASNVAMAIQAVRPHAVDVSGGVEISPGIKDPRKMEEFMQEVARGQAK
jgi:phosphoribosylanthranilate isomerase